MMTPKEVQEHGFPRSRKGYDMAEVDDFLDKLTEDYTALYTNYGKLSTNYTKLRKKAQALAAALEQRQGSTPTVVKQAPAPKVVPKPVPVAQPVSTAGHDAVDELLRAARKDAEAIRAGAERERQEIINQATNYAAENAERLKAEVAAEEARLAAIKKATADYVRQVRQLMGRQTTLLDAMPVKDEDFAPVASDVAEVEEAPVEEPSADSVDEEPTLRVGERQSEVADEISRNMLSLGFDDEDESDDEDQELDDSLDATGSLFDAITGAEAAEFDEE
jgi:cell division initiation protein